MSLNKRCALITGSITGLGFAIANALAREGANIVLHGLESADQARAAAEQLANEHGTRTLISHADLRDVDQIERMMGQIQDTFGGTDIIVNNAVIRHFAAIETLGRDAWDDALAVNLSSAFHTARLSLGHMKRNGWGRIINLSSVYGSAATPNRIGYITTKTALIGMTRAIAMETATSGITCNAIAPGTVPTPAITERIAGIAQTQGIDIAQATHDYLAERQPTGRFVSMENVAALIVFLCSDAGQDMTGALIPIDGGWTAA